MTSVRVAARAAPLLLLPLLRLRVQVLACVVLAAASLLWSVELEYDPWSWLVWGREAARLSLATAGGPAWKPLPVALDAMLVPFGAAAPLLWSVLVRTAGLLMLVAAGRLAALLARPRPLAAGLAVLGTALSAQLLFGLVPLGYSEPMLGALLLLAGEALVRRRPGALFGLLLAASLLRPEAWLLLAAAGGWLVRCRPRTLPLVLASLVGLVLAWFLPDYLSSGDWARSTRRAADPTEGGVLLTSHPAVAVLGRALRTPAPPWMAAFVVTCLLLLRRNEALTHRRALAVVALATAGWAVAVACIVGLGGSSGETRYLIGWTSGVPVVGAAGAAAGLGALLRRRGALARRRLLASGALACLAALAIALSVPRLAGLDRDLASTREHSSEYRALYETVRLAGGARAVAACGPVGVEAHHVPVLAWLLHRHLYQVSSSSVSPGTDFVLDTGGRREPAPPPGPPVASAPPWSVWRTCR